MLPCCGAGPTPVLFSASLLQCLRVTDSEKLAGHARALP